jgi:hypothetical protein
MAYYRLALRFPYLDIYEGYVMIDSKKPQPASGSEQSNRRHRTSEKADEKAYGGAIGETNRHQRLPRDDDDSSYGSGKQRRMDD